MIVKTSEATPLQLNYLVAKCEGRRDNDFGWWWDNYTPSTDWSQGGSIIEREGITTGPRMFTGTTESGQDVHRMEGWTAATKTTAYWITPIRQYGPTPLIAAMRCYVASKLGDTVEVPDPLIP